VNEPYAYSATGLAESKPEIPRSFILHNNYPNPFNPSTSIQVEIPRDGHVRVEILDISGQIVDLLVDEYKVAGAHLLRWDARRKASGVYFCRALYGGKSDVRSMVLLR
jgi:hypothetical protein